MRARVTLRSTSRPRAGRPWGGRGDPKGLIDGGRRSSGRGGCVRAHRKFPGAGEPCACMYGRGGDGCGGGGGEVAGARRPTRRGAERSGREARTTLHSRARAHVNVAGGGQQLRGFGIFNGSSGQPDQCVAANWLREDVYRRRSSFRFVFFFFFLLIYIFVFFLRQVVVLPRARVFMVYSSSSSLSHALQ